MHYPHFVVLGDILDFLQVRVPKTPMPLIANINRPSVDASLKNRIYLKIYLPFPRLVSKIPALVNGCEGSATTALILVVGVDANNVFLVVGARELQYPKKIFAAAIEVPFENERLPIPVGYDTYLRMAFGDYMKLPPKEQQKGHHDAAFLDLDHPYEQYKGIHYCCKK